MRLSTRSTYGMRAMVELGLTTRRHPVSVSLIAKQQELSVAYLEQLLHRLKKRGLVASVRGPKGGYVLAKNPDQISVGDIVGTLDGVAEAPNGTRKGKEHQHAQRIAHAVFHCVHERLANALDEVTLKDLCDEVREDADEALAHRYVFHI